MKKIWLNELIDTRKSTIIHGGIFCAIIFIFVLGCRILGVDTYKLYSACSKLPDSLKACFAFMYALDVQNSVRCFLLIQMVINIPMLFYAALLPARVIGEEDENGTMTFICNAPFSRQMIFYGKLLVCVTNYAIVILAMFIMTMLVTFNTSGFVASLAICVRVFVVLFFVGLLLIGISALYCSIKDSSTSSADNVISVMLLNTVLGYFSLMVLMARDFFLAQGRIVVVNKAILKGFEVLEKLSPVQLCNPAVVYMSLSWVFVVVIVFLFIIMGYVSGRIYEKKEFGWE